MFMTPQQNSTICFIVFFQIGPGGESWFGPGSQAKRIWKSWWPRKRFCLRYFNFRCPSSPILESKRSKDDLFTMTPSLIFRKCVFSWGKRSWIFFKNRKSTSARLTWCQIKFCGLSSSPSVSMPTGWCFEDTSPSPRDGGDVGVFGTRTQGCRTGTARWDVVRCKWMQTFVVAMDEPQPFYSVMAHGYFVTWICEILWIDRLSSVLSGELLTTALQVLKPKRMRMSELRAVLTSSLVGRVVKHLLNSSTFRKASISQSGSCYCLCGILEAMGDTLAFSIETILRFPKLALYAEPLETSGIDELRRQTLEAMGEMVHRMSPDVMVARMTWRVRFEFAWKTGRLLRFF